MAEQEQNEVQPDAPEAPADAPEQQAELVPAEVATAPAPQPKLPQGQHYIWGVGRRKTAVARVRIRPGSGEVNINKRPLESYFHAARDLSAVLAPLEATGTRKNWDVWVNVKGGGMTGQADAVKLGLARALVKAVPDAEGTLRDRGYLTRDARMVERKKYGQPGARKRFQFSKR